MHASIMLLEQVEEIEICWEVYRYTVVVLANKSISWWIGLGWMLNWSNMFLCGMIGLFGYDLRDESSLIGDLDGDITGGQFGEVVVVNL